MNGGRVRRARFLTALVSVVLALWSIQRFQTAQPEPEDTSWPIVFGARTSTISIATAHLQGANDAPWVIVEFADFECAYCADFAARTMPAIRTKYLSTGHVAFAFMHMPAPTIVRTQALPAAQAAECLGRLGFFWEGHDALYKADLASGVGDAKATLLAFAEERGTSPEFQSCLAEEVQAAIAEHAAIAYDLGIVSTPTFIIGRRIGQDLIEIVTQIRGAADIARFSQVLDGLSGGVGQRP